MPRALWSGAISFGLVNVPVRMYSAISEKQLHFRLIHEPSGTRIHFQKVHGKTAKPAPDDEIVKGYELADGDYVYLTADDFAAAESDGYRLIEIRGEEQAARRVRGDQGAAPADPVGRAAQPPRPQRADGGEAADGRRRRAALESGKREGVEAARRDVSAAVDALVQTVRREGPGEQTLAEVATSLQAAAADTGSGDRLLEACLERPLEPPGFEALAGLTLQPSERKEMEQGPPPPTLAERAAEQQRARLVRRVEIARTELDRAEEAHRAAEGVLAEWDDAEP